MFALLLSQALGAGVYVMAPLDIIDANHNINNRDKIANWFNQLRDANVDGIMCDVWWGYTEKSEKNYVFDGYDAVFGLAKERNLKVIPVLSFHQCGGNVGDTCNIPLPSFVLNSAVQPFWKDFDGNIDREYISIAYDHVAVTSRTPIQMYRDFMEAFNEHFKNMINDNIIVRIEVGLGPCGELRYPSYQLAHWSYPGCGQFQSYDPQFTSLLEKAAEEAGVKQFGRNPTNVGHYNTQPGGSPFWRDENKEDGWSSEYGQWFSKWYAKVLIQHGIDVLKEARDVFPKTHLSAKISGIHWWFSSASHCAEMTAGLNNFYFYNGYRDITAAFKMYDVDVCFTCLEMTPGGSGSNPPALVQQVIDATKWAGLKFEGENALPCYDGGSFWRIKEWVPKGLSTFTYLRMCDDLMYNNFGEFRNFVNNMHNA